MNYEDAVAAVAKERGCDPLNLGVCGPGQIERLCSADVCDRVRELMLGFEQPELVGLPSGDVVAAAIASAKVEDTGPGEEDGPWADGWNERAAATPPIIDSSANPKTLMGNLKVPNLSVVPFTGLVHEARAMEYGAYHAPRKDGTKGYGPFNWRDQKIEFLTYAEAAIRHIASAVDREDIDPDTGDLKVLHLGLAKATLGILIDAIEHGSVIDNRSPTARGRVAELLRELRKTS